MGQPSCSNELRVCGKLNDLGVIGDDFAASYNDGILSSNASYMDAGGQFATKWKKKRHTRRALPKGSRLSSVYSRPPVKDRSSAYAGSCLCFGRHSRHYTEKVRTLSTHFLLLQGAPRKCKKVYSFCLTSELKGILKRTHSWLKIKECKLKDNFKTSNLTISFPISLCSTGTLFIEKAVYLSMKTF